MDFVQEFLALKPEVIFKVAEAEVSLKSANNTPPTVMLIILSAIFVVVLILMMLFVGGVCHICKTSPQSVHSNKPVTEQTTVV